MDGEPGEAGTRRRHDGKDPWHLAPAPVAWPDPIAAGDLVALRFVRERDDHQGREEELWVRVVGRAEGGGWTAELDNQPTYIRGLSDGAEVAFGPEHVFKVMPAPR
jgi:hypothetical protein